jgi:hypothetical protein
MTRCIRCPVDADRPCRGEAVPRFCELLDPAEPAYDPGYAQVVERLSAQDLDRPPPAATIAALRAVRACAFRSPGASSCGCARCALRGGAEVSVGDCLECSGRYDAPAKSPPPAR